VFEAIQLKEKFHMFGICWRKRVAYPSNAHCKRRDGTNNSPRNSTVTFAYYYSQMSVAK